MTQPSLSIGDVTLFQKASKQYIGVIRYIGLINGLSPMTQYLGIELMESIGNNGHNGSLNGYSYFDTDNGFGTHCKITDVIQKLKALEIFAIFKAKIAQKNEIITELRSKSKSNPNQYNKSNLRQMSPKESLSSPSHSLEAITPLSPDSHSDTSTHFPFKHHHIKQNLAVIDEISSESFSNDHPSVNKRKKAKPSQHRKPVLNMNANNTNSSIHSLSDFRISNDRKHKSFDEIIHEQISPMTSHTYMTSKG